MREQGYEHKHNTWIGLDIFVQTIAVHITDLGGNQTDQLPDLES